MGLFFLAHGSWQGQQAAATGVSTAHRPLPLRPGPVLGALQRRRTAAEAPRGPLHPVRRHWNLERDWTRTLPPLCIKSTHPQTHTHIHTHTRNVRNLFFGYPITCLMKPKQMYRYAKIDSCIVQHGTTQVQAASQSTPPLPTSQMHPSKPSNAECHEQEKRNRPRVSQRETALPSINQPPSSYSHRGPTPPPKHQLFLPRHHLSNEDSNRHTHTQQRISRIPSPFALRVWMMTPLGISNKTSG
jgi:hypothetical protein